MAMSLEDLLAKEGFKRRKAKMMSRSSFASEGRTMLLYTQRTNQEPSPLKRTERTRSDIPRYSSKGEFSTSSSFRSGNPRDNLSRMGKIDLEDKATSLKHETRGRRDSWDGKRFSFDSSEDMKIQRPEITEVVENSEIVEVGTRSMYKDVYLNRVYVHDKGRNMPKDKLEEALATPALDEAALKAVVSILSGYIKRFAKDGDFRTSLRHNSFASLTFIGSEEGLNTESKVIGNLEQAIEVAERTVEDVATSKELKRASLQLSVITGLNSSDLKERFTSGIPNYKLSACAHLYLSVIYMLQKKDNIAAKHLLQVFCDSPFQARVSLLPDLWDHLFFPHFSNLKIWYENEARLLENPKALEKVYSEVLDSGTYQLASYYKDWLAEGVEAPSVPLIKIPSFSPQVTRNGGQTSNPASYMNSPRAMVSKKLYDEVFRHSHNAGEVIKVRDEENVEGSARSFDSPATEDKQLILYTNQNSEPDTEFLPDDLHLVKEAKGAHRAETSSRKLSVVEIYGDTQRQQTEESVEYFSSTLLPNSEDALYPNVLMQQTESEPPVREVQEKYEHISEKYSPFIIPKDFICPLTGLLFKDPVTLETGQTFEREAIIHWFDNGCITCPVTRKTLLCQAVPNTNLILKRFISYWKNDHYNKLLALVSQKPGDETIISTLEKLIAILSRKDEKIIIVRRVVSLGGLQFFLRRFHCGDANEKAYVLQLLCCCMEADVGCRSDVVRNINKLSLLELLHSDQLKLRESAVRLLIELICFNRRNGAKSFVEGLQIEEIAKAMEDLHVYLEMCMSEEKPMIAVLLLHLDLLSELQIDGIYRHEAVDALTITLERSLSDAEVQKKCSRALLVLGGRFSSFGKLMTEDWILKLSGFLSCSDWDTADNEVNGIADDSRDTNAGDGNDDEHATEKWLMSLSVSLIKDGKKSFLETISTCLSLGNSDLVRVSLTTVVWLSSSLASLPGTELQLYAFSALISPLKNSLNYGELVEHRILASFSLLNFSKIPECRVLLMNIAEEIGPSLENMSEVTWTAKELHTVVSGRKK